MVLPVFPVAILNFRWWFVEHQGKRYFSQAQLRKDIKMNHSLRNTQSWKLFPKGKYMTERHHQKNVIWLEAANQLAFVFEQDANGASRFSGGYPVNPVVICYSHQGKRYFSQALLRQII